MNLLSELDLSDPVSAIRSSFTLSAMVHAVTSQFCFFERLAKMLSNTSSDSTNVNPLKMSPSSQCQTPHAQSMV